MEMSPTIFAVLIFSGCVALFRIAYPRGVIDKEQISDLRRLFYQVVGSILVPAIVVVFTWDRGWSLEAMGAAATIAVLTCVGLYWTERRRRTRPRKNRAN